MGLFKSAQGVYLDQEKEPSLSRDIVPFINPSSSDSSIFDFGKTNGFTKDELIEASRLAEIVDESSGEMLWEKLRRYKFKTIRLLVGDGVDDEPYISSQMNPLLKLGEEASKGMELICDSFSPAESYFTVYKHIFDIETPIPKEIGGFKLKRVGGRFPADSSFWPSDDSTLTIGVGALIFLYRAIYKHEKQRTSFITVAGDCIGNPCNMEVSLGANLMDVIESRGLIKNPSRIIIGGAMSGISVVDPKSTLTTPQTRAILCFSEKPSEKEYECIKCSRCERYCPVGLNPMLIYKMLSISEEAKAEHLGARDCIGCGVCSYVCPSKLDLSASIKQFKTELMGGNKNAKTK